MPAHATISTARRDSTGGGDVKWRDGKAGCRWAGYEVVNARAMKTLILSVANSGHCTISESFVSAHKTRRALTEMGSLLTIEKPYRGESSANPNTNYCKHGESCKRGRSSTRADAAARRSLYQ